MAAAGRCAEAIPELRKAVRTVTNSDLKRSKPVGLHGLRCAMIRNMPVEAEDFLQALRRDFLDDPRLTLNSYAYADLSNRASEQLMRDAPFSYHAHELAAEQLEQQGKWDEAVAEYKKILETNSTLPGIHFRLGRVLIVQDEPFSGGRRGGKTRFRAGTENGSPKRRGGRGAGEIASQAGDHAGAIKHYKRATTLDAGFAEAYVGLDTALVAEKRYAEAVQPLETAVKLAPDDPMAHYNLATALSRVGRKEEADREFAIHRKMQEANPPAATPDAATPDPATPSPVAPN